MKKNSNIIIKVCILLLVFVTGAGFVFLADAITADDSDAPLFISKVVAYDRRYEIKGASLSTVRDSKILKRAEKPDDGPVYDNIFEELTALDPEKLTFEYKEDLSRRMDLYGLDYVWNSDNSLTVNAEGETMTFGKRIAWPDHIEMVRKLPVPSDIAVQEYEENTEDSSVEITVSMTREAADSYIEELKAAGFTYDLKEMNLGDAYIFSACNKEQYYASVSYSSLVQIISISYEESDDPMEFEWPESGIGALLPVPSFAVSPTVTVYKDDITGSEDGLSIDFGTQSSENYKKYVSQLKSGGFGNGISEKEFNGICTFDCYNSDSTLHITLTYAMNMMALEMERSEEGPSVSNDWPVSGLGKLLPKYFTGKTLSVSEEDGLIEIVVSGVTENDYSEYVSMLKETFYYDEEEFSYGSVAQFSAYHENCEAKVECMYAMSQITVTIFSETYNIPENTTIPTSGIAAKLPEITFGTIYEVESSDGYANITIKDVTDKDVNEYIPKLRKAGFSVGENLQSAENYIIFYACDSNGNTVMVYYVMGTCEIEIEEA